MVRYRLKAHEVIFQEELIDHSYSGVADRTSGGGNGI